MIRLASSRTAARTTLSRSMQACRLSSWAAFAFAFGCSSAGTGNASESEGLSVPEGFPAPDVPEDNPFSVEKAELGRHLFYDVRLSENETQSCASCHEQAHAFAQGQPVAIGSTGAAHPRNASALVNTAYNATLTWANPLLTDLESQILIPIFGEAPLELGASGHEREILERLEQDEVYVALFASAFPNESGPLNWDQVVRALSTFVRSLISGNSPFDRFVYHDEPDALSDAAQRGLRLFFSERLECHHCHGGFNFTESSVHRDSAFGSARFHNTGLYDLDGRGAYPPDNTGLFEFTGKPEDMGRFRPPTLRNVAVSGPYMHDGSLETLEDVVRFYEAGGRLIEEGKYAGDGRKNPNKSGFLAGFSLTDDERADLIAFLESLTDSAFLTDPRFSDPFSAKSP